VSRFFFRRKFFERHFPPQFAELELLLGDVERARAIFELAVHQEVLDIPEVLWKAYIDFEIGQHEHNRVRRLYRKLLEKTSHVKVWVSFARFEAEASGAEAARKVFKEANTYLREESAEKEDRLMLLERWKEFEIELGEDGEVDKIRAMLPKRIKKQRKTTNEQGVRHSDYERLTYSFFLHEDQSIPSMSCA
jgi:crooked neck